MKTVTAHCLVKNEEKFIWYSVMSIYKYVDKILLYDTGSTDDTIKIIEEILRQDIYKKIVFKKLKEVTSNNFWQARQEMLDDTKTDWFIVVDGDEMWWDESIEKLISAINSKQNIESIIVPTYNLIGDFYHYQEKEAGKYNFGELKGHYNLRAINRSIPGLKSYGKHGVWGWVDEKNIMIQNRSGENLLFLDTPYLHATFLERAILYKNSINVPKRKNKFKYEIGNEFSHDFYYPEVLFRPRPEIVPSVWRNMSNIYKIKAYIQTPFKKIKRRFLPDKVGY